ncbi:hypothetical protein CEUSTIGMA_g2273.t1, partial [Chlamydomonas eustigma]
MSLPSNFCMKAKQASMVQPITPTSWPKQFHATLFQNRSNSLAIVDLFYDWTGGRNLNIIGSQLGAKGTIFDIEFNNHSSFYYNKDFPDRGCRAIKFEVGRCSPFIEDVVVGGKAHRG